MANETLHYRLGHIQIRIEVSPRSSYQVANFGITTGVTSNVELSQKIMQGLSLIGDEIRRQVTLQERRKKAHKRDEKSSGK
jgi:hypothetical protein